MFNILFLLLFPIIFRLKPFPHIIDDLLWLYAVFCLVLYIWKQKHLYHVTTVISWILGFQKKNSSDYTAWPWLIKIYKENKSVGIDSTEGLTVQKKKL